MIDKHPLQSALYASVESLLENRQTYYQSSVSGYSHFTEEGKLALLEIVSMFAEKMIKTKQSELDKRAKELVINGLKGESN